MNANFAKVVSVTIGYIATKYHDMMKSFAINT